MAYKKILYDLDKDGIVRITLNDPERMNPLGWGLLAELDDALKVAEKDDNARVIIIKGAGRCFSAGYDLSGGGIRGEDEPRGRPAYGSSIWNSRAHVQGHIEYWFNIWNLWKPVIAQVHGFCMAGATELACICDFMVISDNCRFGYPVTRWMNPGDATGLYAWHAGIKVAKEMAMGRILSGKECERYNFANYSFPVEQLEEETTKLAKRLSLIHPELLSLEKRQVCRTFDIMGFRVSVESSGEWDAIAQRGQSYGYREAVEKYGLGAGLKKLNEPWGGV